MGIIKKSPLQDHASTSKEAAVNTIEVETSPPPTRRHRSGNPEVIQKFFESVLATHGEYHALTKPPIKIPKVDKAKTVTKDKKILDMRS